MKTTNSQCIVSGALGFVLYLSCLAGIAPLKFERVPKGWKIKPSQSAHVYGILRMISFGLLSASALYSALSMTPRPFHMRKTLDRTVDVVVLLVVLPVGLVGAVTGFKRMHNLTIYLAQVDKIIKELNQIHKVEKQQKWKIFAAVLLMLLFGNLTIFSDYGVFMYRINLEHKNVAWMSLYIFHHMFIALMQMIGIQFGLISYNVLILFKLLNICLKKLLKKIQANTIHTQFNKNDELLSELKLKKGVLVVNDGFIHHLPKNATLNMRRLSDLYCLLCDVVRVVSESHGTLLVQLLIALLFFLILAPYRLITILFYSSSDELYTAIPQAAWVLLHSSVLLIIVEPCHRTHEEIIVTKKLTSHLMRFSPSSESAFSLEVQNFYRNVILNDVMYSPLGMFPLSRELIMTILGSITTYLVVIVSL